MVTLAYVWTSKFQIFYFSQIVSYALQTSPEPSQTLSQLQNKSPRRQNSCSEAVDGDDGGDDPVDADAAGDDAGGDEDAADADKGDEEAADADAAGDDPGEEDPVDADDGIDVGVGAVVGVCCRRGFWNAVRRRRSWRWCSWCRWWCRFHKIIFK